MGNSESTVNQRFSSEVSNSTKQNCPATKCTNEAEIGPLVIGGRKNRLNAKQRCVAESNCMLEVAYDTATKAIMVAQAKAEGTSAGTVKSVTNSDIKTSLKNEAEQNCGTTEARNKIKFQTIQFTEDSEKNTVDIVQEGDAKSQCVMGVLAKNITHAEGKAAAETTGLSLFGGFGMIIAVVVVVLVLMVLGFFLF